MKKIIAISLAIISILVIGCGNQNTANTIKDNKKLSDVITAVDEAFATQYGEDYRAVAMGMPVDEEYLLDFCEIDSANVDDFSGFVSMSMTNSDTFFGIKAKSQKAEAIKTSLEKRLEDIQNQYEMYNVNGSFDRAKAGEVYQKGDYLFLIVVGVMDTEHGVQNFANDVTLAKTTIDSMFN